VARKTHPQRLNLDRLEVLSALTLQGRIDDYRARLEAANEEIAVLKLQLHNLVLHNSVKPTKEAA
jgi:hypothetical protein